MASNQNSDFILQRLFYYGGVSDAEATELNQELLGSFMTESSVVLCCGGAVCGRKTLDENIFKD